MSKIQGLYTIADNSFSPQWSCFQLAEQFLEGGARIVQLRMKQNREGMLEVAQKIAALKKQFDFLLIINDWPDIALKVGADGVHVGANDMPVREVKRMRSNLIIGYSTHDLEEAVRACEAGADYVAFGAIFPTQTKGPDHPVQGVMRLKELVETIAVPVVAIGGINRANIDAVLATQVQSVAMITALTQSANIVEEVKWFQKKF